MSQDNEIPIRIGKTIRRMLFGFITFLLGVGDHNLILHLILPRLATQRKPLRDSRLPAPTGNRLGSLALGGRCGAARRGFDFRARLHYTKTRLQSESSAAPGCIHSIPREALDQLSVTKLCEILATRFNEGELQTLCLYLDVDYDDLPAVGKAGKARELVRYFRDRRQIPRLVETGKRLRSDIDWDEALAELEVPLPMPVRTMTVTCSASRHSCSSQGLLSRYGPGPVRTRRRICTGAPGVRCGTTMATWPPSRTIAVRRCSRSPIPHSA